MSRHYTHVTAAERDRLYLLKIDGFNQKQIATALGRSESTVSRELSRNKSSNEYGYSGYYAHRSYLARRKSSRRKKINDEPVIQSYTIEKLKKYWSPELISGRIKLELPGFSICHETIYKYIYEEARELIPYLAQSNKHRRRRVNRGKFRKSIIKDRIFIDKRPNHIEKRKQIGHWESDSIVSHQNRYCLHSFVERKSRYLLLRKMHGNTSKNIEKSILSHLENLPAKIRRTITYDNGSENVFHQKINEALGMQSYFCNPYHSWEKGTVENTNGLIRRFFPKATNFKGIWDKTIEEVADLLNNRPRKCLGFKTPAEVFWGEVNVALEN